MILLLDTETSDLADFNKRASDPTQPHIVQAAAMLCNEAGEEVDIYKALVRPEGWHFSPEAVERHGITEAYASQFGGPESEVAQHLMELIMRATLLVGHNLQFDKFIARIAVRRYGLLADEMNDWWKGLPGFCTMRETTDLCGLPGKYGKCKWPKLQETYSHIFHKEIAGAHDAFVDLKATKEIYFWLKNGGAK